MTNMFWKCDEFEQDISGWDTAEVTTMEHMFFGFKFKSAFDLTEWVRIIIPLCLPPPSPPRDFFFFFQSIFNQKFFILFALQIHSNRTHQK